MLFGVNMVEGKKIKRLIIFGIMCLVVAAFLFGFMFVAIDMRGNRFADFDEGCLNFALSIRRGWLTVIFTIITNLVNPIVIGIVGFCILLFAKNKRILSFQLFLNIGIVALLNLVLKHFFVRDRPDEALHLVTEVGYSFPSGHTMFAVAFYGFLIYMLWNSNRKKPTQISLTIVGAVLILLISYSRIYLGVHYASDVIGGLCVATGYLMIYLYVVSRTNKVREIKGTDYKRHTFLGGFKYAGQGIITGIQEENNLLVQFSASMLVVFFGVALRISLIEWCICFIMCFLVMALELVNTSFENLCDRVTMKKDQNIKKIKDISAGAVLMMSICAVIIAGIIFIPKLPFLFK